MIVVPTRYADPQDQKEMKMLIDPDDAGPWAVRYLWVQHRHDNDSFVNNYFDPTQTEAGMNIRKQTAELSDDWKAHNQIFFDSADNGDLVWRVKIGNPISHSIDYIEIWRSRDIVSKHFGQHPDETRWEIDKRAKFKEQLYDKGFDIRELDTYPLISKRTAMLRYKDLIGQCERKENCIINTPWIRAINPL